MSRLAVFRRRRVTIPPANERERDLGSGSSKSPLAVASRL